MKKHIVELAHEFKAELWELCTSLIRLVVIEEMPVDSARSVFRERFSDIGARAGLSDAEVDLVCYGFRCWLLTHMDACAREWAGEERRRHVRP
ncbi:hypothetical protein [Streptomyces sp. NPDC085937]|uniref:hypothetical protein n=1 Tax=Streptomyces sp. NPDC085937 TaxID=3365742 RepID=UPI0037D2D71A